MTVTIRGVENVRRNLRNASAAVREAYVEATKVEALAILEDSQREVPVSEKGSYGNPPGFLRDSKFFGVQLTRDGVKITIDYRAWYAVFVHEIQKAYRVGKWKYLEDPWKRRLPGMASRIAARVRAALGEAMR